MNPIEAENLSPGTGNWKLTAPPNIIAAFPPGDLDRTTNRCPIIEGYAWPSSANIGDTISFYISTISPTYSLQIFRMGYYAGLGGRAMLDPWSDLTVGGSNDPQPDPPLGSGDASNWKPALLDDSTTFQIPTDWVSGCYVGKIEESSGTQSYVFFVVRDDTRTSDLLMQCSITTYHAYNGWGGDSVYHQNNLDDQERNHGEVIWLKRPYLPSSSPNGRFGAGAGAFFTHDKGPGGDQTWVPPRPDCSLFSCSGWEYNMVRWLEQEGYDVTYCTNLDTDANQLTRASHRIFLSVGHDEYWSLKAYNNLAGARDMNGMSILWVSGNTVWNCIDVSNEGQMRVVGNYNPGNARTPGISNPFVPFYDYSLVGGTWKQNGQENFQIASECPVWLTAGVTLQQGDVLGNNLVGYEGNGREPAHPEWDQFLPPRMVDVLESPSAQAIWYTSEASGATVVSFSTIQWSWGLDDFTVEQPADGRGSRQDSNVQQVTRNAIAHCLDAANMVADLADGIYEIQSISAFPQNLIVSNNGAPSAPVIIFGDGTWMSDNNQAKWIIQRYVGARRSQPIVGPYKAAEDAWYTIRNAQNGQHLIVGENGIQDGPVWVYGDSEGNWGQTPDNTQMMWRIWRYASYPSTDPVYILQSVCNGQLLIVGENGIQNGPVIVYGRANGGWGEAEDNPQKLWGFTLTTPD